MVWFDEKLLFYTIKQDENLDKRKGENMRRILFVYPPSQLMPIETPRPDGSLGPLYLIGALRQHDMDADLLDATAEEFNQVSIQENGLIRVGMTSEQISQRIADYETIAIHSNFTPQTNMAFEVARLAKEQGKRVIAGGVNARNMADRFYRTGWFDQICMTEGEHFIVSGKDQFVTNLDELPIPAWDKLPFHLYDRIASPHGIDLTNQSSRYAPIMTSRGCPFRCSYCHISTEKENIGNLRTKSAQRVMQEIEILRNLGVRKLFFEDDSLLAKKKRVQEIFSAVRNYGLTIADVNGVNLVHLCKKENGTLVPDQEYLQLLYDAGFRQIVFPVESASQRILDKYATGKLNHALMSVTALTRIATDIGIACPINMMIGFPDETEKEMMQSVTLARKFIDAGAPYVTFFIPIPFPGSTLYDMAIRNRHLSPDFDPDMMNWKNCVMQQTTVPPDRIMAIRDWAWATVNTADHITKRIETNIETRIADF